MTHDLFVKAAKAGIEGVVRALPPDGDFLPHLHLTWESQDSHPDVVVPLPPQGFDNAASKDAMAAMITLIIAHAPERPAVVGFLNSAWMLSAGEGVSGEQLDEIVRRHEGLATNPHRIEIVFIHSFDGHEGRLTIGRLRRRPRKSPFIIRWDPDEGELDGRFNDAMRAGFAAHA